MLCIATRTKPEPIQMLFNCGCTWYIHCCFKVQTGKHELFEKEVSRMAHNALKDDDNADVDEETILPIDAH